MIIFDVEECVYFISLNYSINDAITASAINRERWYVYILQSRKTPNSKLTYVGKTNNLQRRIDQHNCILNDGKKWTGTRKGIPWQMVAYISGFISEKQALQLEWRLHHPFNKKSKKKSGMQKRIGDLNFVLSLDNWTSNSEPNSNLKITWLIPGYQLNLKDMHQIHDYTGKLPKGSKRLVKID